MGEKWDTLKGEEDMSNVYRPLFSAALTPGFMRPLSPPATPLASSLVSKLVRTVVAARTVLRSDAAASATSAIAIIEVHATTATGVCATIASRSQHPR